MGYITKYYVGACLVIDNESKNYDFDFEELEIFDLPDKLVELEQMSKRDDYKSYYVPNRYDELDKVGFGIFTKDHSPFNIEIPDDFIEQSKNTFYEIFSNEIDCLKQIHGNQNVIIKFCFLSGSM